LNPSPITSHADVAVFNYHSTVNFNRFDTPDYKNRITIRTYSSMHSFTVSAEFHVSVYCHYCEDRAKILDRDVSRIELSVPATHSNVFHRVRGSIKLPNTNILSLVLIVAKTHTFFLVVQ
jgi:hypothetical protein